MLSLAVLALMSRPPGPAAAQGVDTTLPLFPLRQVWSVTLPGAPSFPLAIEGDSGYVALGAGQLSKVSLVNGHVDWTVVQHVTRRPVADAAGPYVVDDTSLVALDATTGGQRWARPLDGAVSVDLLTRSGWIFVVLDGTRLVALRASTGEPVWERRLPAAAAARPGLSGDRLYLALEDSQILAVGIADGATLWATRLGGVPQEPTPLGARLYAGADDNFFYCLDEGNGRILWEWRTGGDIVGAPAADEDHLYFAALDNVLRALARGSGNLQWTRGLPTRPSAGPLRVGPTLLMSGLAPELFAVSTETGEPVGRHTVPVDLLVGPAALVERALPDGNLLVFLSTEGRLLALQTWIGLGASPLVTVPGESLELLPANALPVEVPLPETTAVP